MRVNDKLENGVDDASVGLRHVAGSKCETPVRCVRVIARSFQEESAHSGQEKYEEIDSLEEKFPEKTSRLQVGVY